jgi:hypothetical protein
VAIRVDTCVTKPVTGASIWLSRFLSAIVNWSSDNAPATSALMLSALNAEPPVVSRLLSFAPMLPAGYVMPGL